MIMGAVVLAAVSPLRAGFNIWFNQYPTSPVQSGSSYYVSGVAQSTYGWGCDITIYKSGAYFTSNSGGSTVTAGGSTTDYGNLSVEYFADGYEYWQGLYAYNYVTVTITQPNNPPTIEWSQNPGSALVDEWFNIEAHGYDPDGNLTGVNVWREGTPHAFGGGGDTFNAWSGNGWAQGSIGTVTFTAQAVDGNNEVSSTISHTVTINPVPTSFSLSETSFTYNGSAQGPSIVPAPAGATYYSGWDLSAVDAGNYTAAAEAYGNYTGSDYALNWTINRANQAISFSQPAAQTYGSQLALNASASSGLGVSYSIISGTAASLSFGTLTFTGVGSVTVRASQGGNGNYNAATNVDRTIQVNPMPATFALSATSFTYTGTTQGPSVVPTPSGATFTTGPTLSAVNAGSYNGSATATGNYTGSNNALGWAINKASQAAVTINSSSSATYGTTYTATATGGSGTGAYEWTLGSGSTAPGAAINSSTGTITAKGTGTVVIKARRAADANFLVSAWTSDPGFTVTVGVRPITVTLAGSKSFDGTTTASGASASITTGSLASGDSIGYAYADTSSANPGSYSGLTAATISNASTPTIRTGSYAITYAGSYTINQATITAATITSKVYNGSAQSPSAVSSTTPAGATVSVSATASQTNVGSYTTGIVSGTGNYTGTLSNVPWSITAASQAAVSITSSPTAIYGTTYTATASGGSGTGAYEWTLGSGTTAPGAAINTSTGTITANGTGTVAIKARRAADANFLVSAWTPDPGFTVTVGARPITVSLGGSKIYDGTTTATGASAAIILGDLAAGDSISYSFNATESASPGTYTGITVPAISNAGAPTVRTSNYAVSHAGGYVIRAIITAATVVPLNYNGSAQSPSAVSVTTPANATVTVSAPAQTNVGTYTTATVTGTGDFAGTLNNVSWSIVSVPQDPLVIDSPDSMIFASPYTAHATGGSGTGALVWALGDGSTATGAAIHASTGAVTATSTGTVVIKVQRTGDTNYPDSGWSSDFEIIVNKADQAITFNNPGPQTYATPLSLNASASSGLAVTYSIVSGPATISGSVVSFTGVGNVTVRASQGGNGNYNAAPHVDQTFTINPAPTTFSLSPASFTYNGTAQGPAIVPSPGGATFTAGGALTAIAPGNYTATASAYGNYIGTNNALTWVINKATPAGSFQSPRYRGTQTPTAYTVQVSDLNASFAPAGVGTTPAGVISYSIISASGGGSPSSGALNSGTILTLGTYVIRASYPGDANYTATTIDAVWHIVLDVDGDGIPGYLEVLLGLDPNVSNNEADAANHTQLKIHRPNQ